MSGVYVPAEADVEELPRTPVTAATVIELALLLPFRKRVSAAQLRRTADGYALTFVRGRRVLTELRVDPAEATRAIGMLARLVGLDPLLPTGPLGSSTNLMRVNVRLAGRTAGLLVTLSASPHGLEAEVATLTVDGGPPANDAALKRCSRCGGFAPPGDSHCERDRAPLVEVSDDPRPGGTIGLHRVEAEIGRGATGVVYSATHLFLARPVAIKVLHESLATNVQQRRMFLDEARAASRIRHPGVLEVTDFGVLPDGRPYVVMERLNGVPLTERISDQRAGGAIALEVTAALRIARNVARALSAAHSAGVIHNDLKPSNIMLLGPDETLKVIDFGAASLVEASRGADDLVIGTPHFMSPEHIRGAATDARSDLYSLGVVLFRLISGALPFEAEDVDGLLRAHLDTPPPLVTSPHGALHPSVVKIVSRALAKDPETRHQSAEEMALEIERVLGRLEAPAWRRWLS